MNLFLLVFVLLAVSMIKYAIVAKKAVLVFYQMEWVSVHFNNWHKFK